MPQAAPDSTARWHAETRHNSPALRPVPITPIDGNFRREILAGRPCLRTDRASGNGYLYFDISRRWLRALGAAPFSVEATVEFLDDNTDTLSLQFDSPGNSVDQNFQTVTLKRTGTGQWVTRNVVLESAEFANSQHGQADLRIAAGTTSDIAVAALSLNIRTASKPAPDPVPPPPPSIPTPDEIQVRFRGFAFTTSANAPESVRIAGARWQSRAKALGAKQASGGVQIVSGVWETSWASRYPKTAALIARAKRLPLDFQRRDTAIVCVERSGKNPLVCAVGLEAPGAVNAVSTLERGTLLTSNGPALFLPRVPSPDTPAFDRREIYINIGYGLRRPGITVEDWTLERWKEAIDHWIASGLNTWSFYLWGDGQTLHPASANAELNRHVHKTLKAAIDYSHRRGMRVGMHFTPGMVPVALWKSRPDLHAKLEYDYPGTVCTSQADSRKWMVDVHRPELRWFDNVDFTSLWFYDVGGCFCPTCRKPENQRAALDWQVRTFRKIAADTNPHADFQVMGWAIWRYENKHQIALRQPLIETSLNTVPKPRLILADGLKVDPGATPLFPDFERAGVRSAGFLYQTNIETGQPFPLGLSRLLESEIRAAQRAGIPDVFFMRMEAGSKTTDDTLAARFLWNPQISPGQAMLETSRLITGSVTAAQHLAQALVRIDDFAWNGYGERHAGPVRGREIQKFIRAAVDSAPVAFRNHLEWLAATGDAYRILGDAVAAHADEDTERLAALDREFTTRMRQSRLFRHQADGAAYWKNLFKDVLCRCFHAGYAAGAF